MEPQVCALDLSSRGVGIKPDVENTPDVKTTLKSSTGDISTEENSTLSPKEEPGEDFLHQYETGPPYFDDYDFYYSMPPDDDWLSCDVKPLDLPEKRDEKPVTDFPDQRDEFVSKAHRELLLEGSGPKGDGKNGNEDKTKEEGSHSQGAGANYDYKFSLDKNVSKEGNMQEVGESAQGAETNCDYKFSLDKTGNTEGNFHGDGESAQGAEANYDYKFSLDEILSDLSNAPLEKPATDVPDQELQHKRETVSNLTQEVFLKENIPTVEDTSRGEYSLGRVTREDIQESVNQIMKTLRGNYFEKGIPESVPTAVLLDETKVEVEIVSGVKKSDELGADSQTPGGTNREMSKFSDEDLRKIWDLAKKLCEARIAYNENVCRPLPDSRPNQKLPLKKRKPSGMTVAHCRRGKRPNTMTNGGVCTIGKGDDSLYDNPRAWDWGQPLPKKISEVIPSRPAPGTPTITLDDDECPASSACFEKASSLPSFKRRNRLPDSKSLKISISVKRFQNSHDTTVVLSDSDEELTDFSMELGIQPRYTKSCSRDGIEVRSEVGSCAVVHAATARQLAPVMGGNGRKRLHVTANRGSGGPSGQNVNPQEIVLGSSDDSDEEPVVIEITKKSAPREPPKPNPVPMTTGKEDNSKSEWSCPICMEPKDKVENIMSTTCGHIFCGPCLQSTIKINKQCPNCRKKLTLRQIHNLYL